jgi:hypothetical protein
MEEVRVDMAEIKVETTCRAIEKLDQAGNLPV